MARVVIDTAKIIQFAEQEAILGLRAAAQRIEMSAKLQIKSSPVRRDSSSGGRAVLFVASTKRGRKSKARVVSFVRKADFREIRYPGQLRDSVRIVEKEGRKMNLRVVMGHYQAYYAPFYERGTVKMSARKVMQKATVSGRAVARKMLEQAQRVACDRANRLIAA